jgi:cytoskeletal protein CcmA (bactofilin family)
MKNHTLILLAFLLLLSIILNVSISLPYDFLQTGFSENENKLDNKYNFTPIENWVLKEIKIGKVANLSFYPNHEREKSNNLSVYFLKKLLFDKQFHQYLSHKGICITGASFLEELDLEDGEIKHQLSLESCTFLKKVNMKGIITNHGISFVKSVFNNGLFLSGAKINGHLELDEVTFRYIEAENIKVNGPITMERAANKEIANFPNNNPRIDTVTINLTASVIEGQLKFDKSNFFGSVKMPGIVVSNQLSMKKTLFYGSLVLSGALIEGQLTMEKAWIFGSAKFYGIKIKNRLEMNDANILKIQDSSGSKIEGNLYLSGSKIEGKLEMNNVIIQGQTILESAIVYSDLSIKNSKINYFDLSKANINGQFLIENDNVKGDIKLYNLTVKNVIRITESECQGIIELNNSEIGSSLDLKYSKFFKEVELKGTNIDGDVDFTYATFDNLLDMTGTTIEGKVLFKGTIFKKILDMTGTTIRGTVIFIGGIFNEDINLGLAQIKSVEYKGVKNVRTMNLTGANANKIIVEIQNIDQLPSHLELHGFIYNLFILRYTGRNEEEETFFQKWLDRIDQYKPQPYKKCAEFLREAGYPDRADQILFSGRQRQRRDAWKNEKYLTWAGLSLLRWSIGYGIGKFTFLALYWILLFTLLGMLACMRPQAKKQFELEGHTSHSDYFFYSLDMLLPLISLRKKNEEIELPRLQRIYFNIHKIVGWLLLSFILASLAGITQV